MKRPTSTSPVRNVAEAARLKKMRGIVHFFGKGFWKGDLSEMRDDYPRRRTPSSRAVPKRER